MAKLTEKEKELRRKAKKEKERLEMLRLRDITDAERVVKTLGLPNERKTFSVGESVYVFYGSFISAYIKEVIDTGIYLVSITSEPTKPYSKETHIVTNDRVLNYTEIFKLEEVPLPKLEPKLFIQFYQQELSSVLGKCIHLDGVDFSPEYQRELVWEEYQKEMLLDSIFQSLDIGKFVFIRNKYAPGRSNYTILDGKQRLTTLLDFYLDKFTYRGCYYSQLPWEYKIRFKQLSVSVGEVNEEDLTEKDILKYFLKLNSTGVPMAQEHLNKVKNMLNNG